jgi:hypothetical protein
MKKIFVCHPFARDPGKSFRRVSEICLRLASEGIFPIAPQIYLPQFLDESNQRNLALRLCRELVRISDEIRVYGDPTEGMRMEIAEARRLGIPIVEGEPE